ncbi:hypothetical protein B0H14DRAFT_3115270 [Mycena olivaceomarginata]|nr:hypothetical protein B0H14DRAFT_3115270 [Mycena olivaceomarginata]
MAPSSWKSATTTLSVLRITVSPARNFWQGRMSFKRTGKLKPSESRGVTYCRQVKLLRREIEKSPSRSGETHPNFFALPTDPLTITGVGDFTKINIRGGDSGGELDPHGADSNGNPVGGLVFGNTLGSALQYHEWTSFISDTEFCFRALPMGHQGVSPTPTAHPAAKSSNCVAITSPTVGAPKRRRWDGGFEQYARAPEVTPASTPRPW